MRRLCPWSARLGEVFWATPVTSASFVGGIVMAARNQRRLAKLIMTGGAYPAAASVLLRSPPLLGSPPLLRFPLRPLVLLRSRAFLWPLIPARRPGPAHLYDVDVPAMSLELHEWDIHAVCCGTGGAGVTGVRPHVPVLPHWSQPGAPSSDSGSRARRPRVGKPRISNRTRERPVPWQSLRSPP
jgi:hypothetical protein